MSEAAGSEQHSSKNRLAQGALAPWRLSWVALILFVLFATIIAGAAWPLKLLNPTWQLGLISAMINTSGYPLVGLGLLHLAADLDPRDQRLSRRRRLCARLAVPVVLGFLLLAPLQAFSFWQWNSTRMMGREAELVRSENTIKALRRAVDSASSARELQQRLQALKGPSLSPGVESQPLPLIKAQARDALQQAEGVIRQQRQRMPDGGVFSTLQLTLRNGIACVALALGFAALAQRRYSNVPLLQEWLHGFQQMRTKNYWRRITRPMHRKRRPFG